MSYKVNSSYKKHKWALIFGPLIKLIEAVFDLLIPLFMKAIIDLNLYDDPSLIDNTFSKYLGEFIRSFGSWASDRALSDALIGGTIILVLGIIGYVITMYSQYIAARTSVLIGSEIRDELFRKILSFSKKEREEIGNGKLLNVLNSDTYQVQRGVLIFIRLIARAPFIIIGSLIISFILNWKIGLAFALIVPLILIVIFVVVHKASKHYESIQRSLDEISSKNSDTIIGNRVIRAFNNEQFESDRFKTITEKYQNKSIKTNIINSLINPLTFAITSLVVVIIIFVLSDSLLNGSDAEKVLLSSTIIAEMAYLAQIFFTTVQLTMVLLDVAKARVSVKRIDNILTIDSKIFDGPLNAKDSHEYNELIEFNHVYFSYSSNDNAVLKDLNFKIKKGQTIGVIGGTGSGKSTIVELLERFYDVTDGELLYKGHNIKEYNLSSLRNDIGLVNQKSSLFKGTIRSNILVSNPSLDDKDIISSLKSAQAYEFVSKYEDGIDHEVKEGGSNYSGGQKQRLCIARAIAKKPELLILDDATSALDLLTDSKIRHELNEMKDVTKIIVSQRVATISNSDLIIVLDKGEVVGLGKHFNLMKTCDVYKDIYKSQIKENENE